MPFTITPLNLPGDERGRTYKCISSGQYVYTWLSEVSDFENRGQETRVKTTIVVYYCEKEKTRSILHSGGGARRSWEARTTADAVVLFLLLSQRARDNSLQRPDNRRCDSRFT